MEKIQNIIGKNIGETYCNALNFMVKEGVPHYLTVHITQPILNRPTDMIESCNIEDWTGTINLGKAVYKSFSKFKFSKACKTGGSTGKDWINDRIKALLHPEGEYWKRLELQLKKVESRLRAKTKAHRKMHGGSTNALVCQVFLPKDLEKACIRRPRGPKLPCLTSLDFKPKKDKLNLLATFRSQYFDTKAYGNFISLAILLYKMCRETEYDAGYLVSSANNVTFDDPKFRSNKQLQSLLKKLLDPSAPQVKSGWRT